MRQVASRGREWYNLWHENHPPEWRTLTGKQWAVLIAVILLNVVIFASLITYLLTSGEPPTPTPTRTPRPTFTPIPSRTPTPILMPTYPPTPTSTATPTAGPVPTTTAVP